MAKKIGVLAPSQKNSDEPIERIKKSKAVLMVRRLQAVWVIEHSVIRRLPLKDFNLHPSPIPSRSQLPIVAKAQLPKKMPICEIPGLHFEDPVKYLQSIRRFHVIVANGIGGRCEA